MPYTNDTPEPEPEPNNLTLMFADDVTQIITTYKTRRTGLCNRTLTLRTQRKVGKQTNMKENGKSRPT